MGMTLFASNMLSMVYIMYSFWAPIIMVPLCAGFLGFKAKNKEFIASTIAAACAVSYGYYLELFPPVVLISGIIASFISFLQPILWLRMEVLSMPSKRGLKSIL